RCPLLAVEAEALELLGYQLAFRRIGYRAQVALFCSPEPDLERAAAGRLARVGFRWEDPRLAEPAGRAGGERRHRIAVDGRDDVPARLVVLAPPADRAGLQVDVAPAEVPDGAVARGGVAPDDQRQAELPVGRVLDQL